jgi:hypothetical protein
VDLSIITTFSNDNILKLFRKDLKVGSIKFEVLSEINPLYKSEALERMTEKATGKFLVYVLYDILMFDPLSKLYETCKSYFNKPKTAVLGVSGASKIQNCFTFMGPPNTLSGKTMVAVKDELSDTYKEYDAPLGEFGKVVVVDDTFFISKKELIGKWSDLIPLNTNNFQGITLSYDYYLKGYNNYTIDYSIMTLFKSRFNQSFISDGNMFYLKYYDSLKEIL